jgi:hypothetical protein
MPSLKECVGNDILIRATCLDDKPVFVKLIEVEAGGIWIESQVKTNEILKYLNAASAPRTPVFFLPFAAIAWISYWIEGPALSEESFGVVDPDQDQKG